MSFIEKISIYCIIAAINLNHLTIYINILFNHRKLYNYRTDVQ